MDKTELKKADQKVLDFLNQKPKHIIVKLKYNKAKIDLWVERLLNNLPHFYVKFINANNSPELPCDYWLFELLNSVDNHCSHCREFKGNRDFTDEESACSLCLEQYKTFIKHFCNHCNREGKTDKCTNRVIKLVENKLKSRGNLYREPKAYLAFSIFCNFDDEKESTRSHNFNLFNTTLSFSGSETVEEVLENKIQVINRFREFISNWFEIKDNVSDKRIFEIGLKICAVHYLFFFDFLNKTIFKNTPFYKAETVINDDNESINVIAAYELKKAGDKDADIEKIVSDNININQIVNYRLHKQRNIFEMNVEHINLLMNKIIQIYNFPLLENVAIKDLNKSMIKTIKDLIRIGKLKSSRVRIKEKSSFIDDSIPDDYLMYIVLIKLISLFEAAKKTRFTNKLPTIFQDENLLEFYKEMTSGPLTFKKTCENLGFKYKATHMAIMDKIECHPRYAEITDEGKHREYSDYKNYRQVDWFFMNSSEEHIIQWANTVKQLQK